MDTPTPIPRPPQAQLIGYLQVVRDRMPIIPTQEQTVSGKTRQTCTPADAIAALKEALHELPIAISFTHITPPTYKRCFEHKNDYKSGDKIQVPVYRASVWIRFTITDGELLALQVYDFGFVCNYGF